MKKALIGLTILLSVIACGPKSRDRSQVNRLTATSLILPPEMSAQQRAKLTESIAIHRKHWEQDAGYPSQHFIATVTTQTFIMIDGKEATGLFTSPNNILVVAGSQLEVPAMYHELSHLNAVGWDVNHTQLDWDKINARGREVAAIAAQR